MTYGPRWRIYPPDIPLERRRTCEVCGAPGEVVEVIPAAPTAYGRPDTTHVFCKVDGEARATSEVNEGGYVSAVDRLLYRLLGHSDLLPPKHEQHSSDN
jgi:hypothetical protein